jgi:hypothetical protein
MAIIDPLEAVLSLAQANADIAALVGNRVAAKHKFATKAGGPSAWTTPSKALVIRYDVGGQQELYIDNQCIRLAAECYGEDAQQAGRVYTAVIALFRVDDRRVAPTSQGNALIYWVVPDGTPLSTRNEDVQADMITVPLQACVAEAPV